ncbi:cytidine deaminase [Candidatus Chlorohelix sp.]|uniref:cytidine deaminase n=1 Tax=Candidatus Chlorohelix sp. TaxID=3139201 RepID=UPI003052B314
MNDLIDGARAVREHAYAPYSGFKVGAALRTRSGKIFYGVNVENISYGLTICAERSAAVAAVLAGELEWDSIAVVADTKLPTTPCGACRQFLAEFNHNLSVIVANLDKVHYTISLTELLPHAFNTETIDS